MTAPASGPFDPGDYTVSQVMGYVHAHPEEREAILAAEEEGKGRTTLIERLQ